MPNIKWNSLKQFVFQTWESNGIRESFETIHCQSVILANQLEAELEMNAESRAISISFAFEICWSSVFWLRQAIEKLLTSR